MAVVKACSFLISQGIHNLLALRKEFWSLLMYTWTQSHGIMDLLGYGWILTRTKQASYSTLDLLLHLMSSLPLHPIPDLNHVHHVQILVIIMLLVIGFILRLIFVFFTRFFVVKS